MSEVSLRMSRVVYMQTTLDLPSELRSKSTSQSYPSTVWTADGQVVSDVNGYRACWVEYFGQF